MAVIRTPIPNAFAGVDYQQVVGHLRYHVGVDLGTLQDPTAVAIIEDVLRPAPRWGKAYRQLFEPRRLTMIQAFRLKVGIDWVDVLDFIERMMKTPPLQDDGSLIVDTTGLGNVVGAMLRERKIDFTGVTITAGDSYSEQTHSSYRCSKMYLLSNLATQFQSGELRIASGIKDAKAFRQQVEDFSAIYTPSGNMTFQSGYGKHDDLLFAAALAGFASSLNKGPAFTVSQLNWG